MTTPPASPSTADPALEAGVFWLRHKNEVLAAFAIVLLALIAWAGYWFYQQHRDAAAADALAKAKTPPELQNVTTRFTGTPAGATAFLLLAEQQRSDKKFAEANTTLQSFLEKNPKHELTSTARMAMAANLESLGKRDEALSMYQRISTGDAHSFNAPLALLAQARLLKEKSQIDEARRVCETILTQYRDSFVAGEATRQLRMLKPAKAVVGVPAGPVMPTAPGSQPIPPTAPSANVPAAPAQASPPVVAPPKAAAGNPPPPPSPPAPPLPKP